MRSLVIAAVAISFTACASTGSWRSLRLDGNDETSFKASVAALLGEMNPARREVFELALQDIRVLAAAEAAAEEREPAPRDFLARVHGLGFAEIVTATDPTGETAKERYQMAMARWSASAGPMEEAYRSSPWPIREGGFRERSSDFAEQRACNCPFPN